MTFRIFKYICVGLLLPTSAIAAEPVWRDEFDAGTINREIWSYHVGGHGFGNGQLEYNTDRPENSYIEDGKLVIEARREPFQGNAFTSARMVTQGKFAFVYGRLEGRIKLPDTANGIWPAFWTLGHDYPRTPWPQCGEIDILEIGSKEGIRDGLQRRKINSALHFADKGDRHDMRVAWHDASTDLNLDYHTYSLDWTPQRITFAVDNTEIGSWDLQGEELREFHHPHFILLNVAVGGSNPSYTGVYDAKSVTAPMPSKMYVDWLRLYANEHTKMF